MSERVSAARKDDCLFCKIVAGEIPSYKVYEDGDFIAILDRFPRNLGHTLIIPKEHFDDLFDLPGALAERLLPLARELAGKVKEATGCEGLNLVQNNGEASGQEVKHFHLHIIPRFLNDRVSLTSANGRLNPAPKEFEEMLERLVRHN